MNIKLLQDEILLINKESISNKTDEISINDKYEEGHNRIVTEQGSYKLPLLKSIFNQSNYKLKPEFQRRINWDNKKKSKLIESFIINIPIPPVFIYERDFDSYEVMDGLQRISSIISFYNDEFILEGLEEWSELNGFNYSKLPQKIREGIDRRQLSTITLLKESAKNSLKAEKMKKMVFERLNTGGVKLEAQEIRNALHDGPFNKKCIDLSTNDNFRYLWKIQPSSIIENEEDIESEDDSLLFANDKLYKRMYDVELVLRFFAMRHIDSMQGQLNTFLDYTLTSGNVYDQKLIDKLGEIFESTMKIIVDMFGENAFCQFKEIKDKSFWTKPQRVIYDPLCLVISSKLDELRSKSFDIETNNNLLKLMYQDNPESFNGKKQSKQDILDRVLIIEKIINQIILDA